MKIDINKASRILRNGDLVIFPTETVYGLGANANNQKAIERIYKIKNRPKYNPLICHFYNISKIKENFFLNDTALKLARNFWPGPLTLILEKKNSSKINLSVSNGKKFIGCRIPKHPIAQRLLRNLNFPIAAPSANISNKLSSTNIGHLSKRLKKNTFIINGGESEYGLESTVIDAQNNSIRILRLGSITYEQIKKIDPNVIIENNIISGLSPGLQKKHYSPNLPLRINVDNVYKGESLLNFGKNNLKSDILELNLSLNSNLEEAAKNLYDFMHILDESKSIGIAAAPIPNCNLGKTINDRLIRASSN